ICFKYLLLTVREGGVEEMGTVGVILSWALCGLIVGLIARVLVPGSHPLGILRTILLGVVGAFVGGLLYFIGPSTVIPESLSRSRAMPGTAGSSRSSGP